MAVMLITPKFIVTFSLVLFLQFNHSEMQTTSIGNPTSTIYTGQQIMETFNTSSPATSAADTGRPMMMETSNASSLTTTSYSSDNIGISTTGEVEATLYSDMITIESFATDIETFEPVTVGEDMGVELWQLQEITWEWWNCLQVCSAFLGFLGNAMVILVLFQKKASFSSTDRLIGSLAIADLLTSLFLVPIPGVVNIPATWLGEVYCKVVYTSRFMWISVSASVFTLTLISVERFVAVAYPFRFKEIFSRRRTNFFIVLVWIMALVMNSFAFFVFFVDPNSHSCTISFPTENGGQVLGIISFFLVLVNPTAVMVVTQALTVYKLHLEAKKFQGMDSASLSKSQPSIRLLGAKKRVIKLLFIINVTFILCWAPNQSAYLAFNLGLLDPSYLYGPLDRALVVLAFCNSCANPFIYTIQHPQFRAALKGFFTKRSSPTQRAPVFSK